MGGVIPDASSPRGEFAAVGDTGEMFAPLLLLLIVVPIVELALIVRVARVIETGPTLLLLIGISFFGAWLLKKEGMAAWRRAQRAMAEGRMPTKEVADGALILFGGALLLTPGFLTDAIGFLCVIPVTRVTMKGAFRKLLGFFALKRFGMVGHVGQRVYNGRVVKSRRNPPPGSAGELPPEVSPPTSSPAPGSDEGDSRDRG
jgi:UPF0716 family protein affecting phage T7 exclusion